MSDEWLIQANAEIDKLDKQIDDMIFARQTIQTVMEKYPDLQLLRLDDGDYMMCSALVNKCVDDYEYYERKSTLIDENDTRDITAIEVWPYTVVDDHRIHSNPPCYVVGEINEKGFGVTPYEEWEDKMAGDEICNTAIRKIRAYLKGRPPITYLEDDNKCR